MAESQDALLQKKRARRRLIGAIALVLFVVIVLPMVLDKEPRPPQNELSVQIPNQDADRSKPVAPQQSAIKAEPAPELKLTPKMEEKPAAKEEAAPRPAESKPEAKPAAVEPKPAAAAPDKSEQLRAQAILNDETWVVAMGTFSSKDNVKQLRGKLSAAGVKSYTEMVKTAHGEQTRVRAGPFTTRDAADKARAKLKAAGIDAGVVTAR